MNHFSDVDIEETETFLKVVKKLRKRFWNIDNDYRDFAQNIKTIDDLGISLGNEVYKVRIPNSDKKSGKSSGYRLISYLKIMDKKLYFIYIYDKSDLDTVSEKQIDELVKKIALEN